MKSQKSVKANNQKYEQVSQNDDKSEIIIFQTNKKISVSSCAYFGSRFGTSVFLATTAESFSLCLSNRCDLLIHLCGKSKRKPK